METRSQSKQQEEQFAKFMAVIQQQNAEQKQQFVDFATQQQDLVQKQNERWESLEKRQHQADSAVEALQNDIASLKTVTQDRLRATEEVQSKLMKELHVTKDALRDELLGELETRFTTKEQLESAINKSSTRSSPLSVSAPEFVPSSDVVPGQSAVHGHQIQRPQPFSGDTPWDAYKLQFEMLAEINKWSEDEKASFLAISLRGPALTVLTNLPPEGRRTYTVLVAALDKRFGTAHQTELNRMKLRSRTRKSDESLQELAGDVERLARLAYPDATDDMLDIIVRDQFLNAFRDEDLRLRVRQSRPTSANEALERALELESYQLANRHRSRTVREVQLEQYIDEGEHTVNKTAVDAGSLEKLQQCLLEAIQHCSEQTGAATASRDNSVRGMKTKGVYCWGCGEEGHIRRFCRKAQEKKKLTGVPSTVKQSGNDQ